MSSHALKSAQPPPDSLSPQRGGLSGVRKRQIKTFLVAMLFLAPSLIVFMTFVFIPLVRSFILSAQLTDPIGRPAAFVGWEMYRRLFTTPVFLK